MLSKHRPNGKLLFQKAKSVILKAATANVFFIYNVHYIEMQKAEQICKV